MHLVRAGILALLTLACIGASGCAQGGDAGGTVVQLGDGSSVQLQEAPPPTSGKGAISGVVVDAAIRPLVGVAIANNAGDPVTSDDSGLFVMTDLEPGLYTLMANLTGYLPVQTTAEVRAGQTEKVRIVMALDPTPQPYHTTLKFDGFVQLGNGLVTQAYDLFVGEEVGVFSCTCIFYFGTQDAQTTFIVEATWEQSVPNPTGDPAAYWTIYDNATGEYAADTCYQAPNCWGIANATDFPPEARDFYLYMWLESGWVVVNQQYQVFLTLFYNGAAPQGWSFLEGDE